MALLQILVRIELIERALQLPVRGFIARHLRAHETLPQPIELIIDLLASRFECSRECRIDCREFLSQTIEFVIDVLLRVREELRTVSREMLFDDALGDSIESFKQI